MSHEAVNAAFRLRLLAAEVRDGTLVAAIRQAMAIEGVTVPMSELRDPDDTARCIEAFAERVECGR